MTTNYTTLHFNINYNNKANTSPPLLLSNTTSHIQFARSLGLGALFLFPLVGLVTNALNLFILTKKCMKSTVNMYLSALALCDLFALFFSILSLSNSFADKTATAADASFFSLDDNNNNKENRHLSVLILRAYECWTWRVYPLLFPFVYPLAIMFQVCSVWLNLAMSVDRFIAVHMPLRSLKYCTIRNARKQIMLVFAGAFLYALPRFFEYKISVQTFAVSEHYHHRTAAAAATATTVSEKNNDTTMPILVVEFLHNDFTRMGKSRAYRAIIYIWMYILMHSVLPLLILFVINVWLILSLKNAHKNSPKKLELCTIELASCSFATLNMSSTTTTTTNKSRANNNNERSFRRSMNSFRCKQLRSEITLMVVVCMLLFILLQTPAVLCNSIYGIQSQTMTTTTTTLLNHCHHCNNCLTTTHEKNWLSVDSSQVCYLGNIFILACSSTNFFFYMIFNQRFRRELRKLFTIAPPPSSKAHLSKKSSKRILLSRNSLRTSTSLNNANNQNQERVVGRARVTTRCSLLH